MSFRINTNVTGLTAFYNLTKSSSELSKSVERLSSGLRINRAADDSAGLYIGTGLNSQALGLGQAIRNANDGISIMQIADDALDESINILNSIKTKAVQAAQDSQTTTTRRTIQEDIDKLLEELDIIAQTTSYNNQDLLTGVFSGKEFQIGAYTGETLPVSIGSAESLKVGHVRTAQLSLTNSTGGAVELSFYSNLTNETLTIKSVSVEYDNTAANSMDALADAINAYTETTGVSGRAVVESTTDDPVEAGATGSDFAINDITIGAVTTQANDADNSLTTAINAKTSSHGVTASITSSGQLKLVSSDGRAIKVSGAGSALTAADANNISTFGYVQLYQQGSYDVDMTNLSEGLAVSFTSNLNFSGTLTTTIDSTLAAGSILGSGTFLEAGWTAGRTITGALISGDIATTADSTLLSGTVLASGSVIEKSTVLGGTVYNSGTITTTANSLLKAGSIITSGSVLEAGTYLTNTIYGSGSQTINAGSTLSTDITLSGDQTQSNDILLLNGSVLASDSKFTAGSYIGEDVTISGSTTTTQNMTLLANSTIADVDGTTSIAAGSTIWGDTYIDADQTVTLTQSMTLETGSILASTSELATGSTLGGDATLTGAHTTSADLALAATSVLASGSTLKTGTVLTNDIYVSGGTTIDSGTTLEADYNTSGSNTLNNAMTLESGSILASSSVMAANSGGAASTQLTNESTVKLTDLSVLTADDAQTAIVLADAAISDINRIRSNIGSIQNQFSSSVSNLTTTKLNILSAYSNIMDVDFSEETLNFTKMQVLVQTGSFALTQANAQATNVIALLQGGTS